MSEIIRNPYQLSTLIYREKNIKKSIGLVPTMGALHDGHSQLLKKCRMENDICVLSIFVNPTQFNDPKDFELYPSNWERDLQLAKEHKVDYLFAPTRESIYSDGCLYRISEHELSQLMCGKSRPGHFDGVLTVVMKLMNIVKPDRVYFGEKDFQQLNLIQGMVNAFFLPYEVVAVPTVREPSGLALSSRNERLSQDDKSRAYQIYETIKDPQLSMDQVKNQLEQKGFVVDYVNDYKGRRYAAVFLGNVRLIDNVPLT